MENKKEYLSEETYQKNKKKITTVALIVLVLGLLLGGSLIATGIMKQSKVNSNYSSKSKEALKQEIETEKEKLQSKKTELEAKKTEALEIAKAEVEKKRAEIEEKIKPVQDEIKSLEREEFNGFDDAYYARQDKIEELKKSIKSDTELISDIEYALDGHCIRDNEILSSYCAIVDKKDENSKGISAINNALDDSFDHCKFNDTKNNTYTSKYCSLKNELEDKNDFNRDFAASDSIPFYMIGAFVIFASCMMAGFIYMIAKRREILAFGVQGTMPVAQEGIEKIAPSVGKAAKEISKGIKDGLK